MDGQKNGQKRHRPHSAPLLYKRQDVPSRRTRRDVAAVTLGATMRLHRKKRPVELLRAFALAARRADVHARLLIVGEGPECHAMQREIRELGLAGEGSVSAELTGWKENRRNEVMFSSR